MGAPLSAMAELEDPSAFPEMNCTLTARTSPDNACMGGGGGGDCAPSVLVWSKAVVLHPYGTWRLAAVIGISSC